MLEFMPTIYNFGTYDFAAQAAPPFPVLKYPQADDLRSGQGPVCHPGGRQELSGRTVRRSWDGAEKYDYQISSGTLIRAPNRGAFYLLPSKLPGTPCTGCSSPSRPDLPFFSR